LRRPSTLRAVLFKFWCFKSLRELSPDTQVILDDIDRH
jgi:hypothetical protein